MIAFIKVQEHVIRGEADLQEMRRGELASGKLSNRVVCLTEEKEMGHQPILRTGFA